MTPNTPEKLLNGRYRLDQQQGSGGMAVIYKATDLALGRTVAVKILRPSLTNDTSFLTRFRQEARNVANLSHPNIVTVHDVGQDGNTHYIVMEFIDGLDLKKIIRAEAPLSLERMLNLSIQICAGIGYAHRAGLVHADVKPQNILVTAEERVKVTDFGIAQALAMTKPSERQKIVWGSPHYFSPEQAQGEYPTPASDVYAIGIVLFEMLTGQLPFNNSDQQELALAHVKDTPPNLSDFNPQVPPALEKIVLKVISKEPSARYRTADQLGRILTAYKEQGQEATSHKGVVVSSSSAPTNPAITTRPEPRSPYAPPLPGEPPPPTPPLTIYSQPPMAPTETPTAPSGYAVQSNIASISTPPSYTYLSEQNYVQPPEVMTSPGYRQPRPQSLDMVTLTLAFIALIAVAGVALLWIFVFNAYYG